MYLLHYIYYNCSSECSLFQSGSQLPPISVSMRSRLLWRSLCTMKSSRERMRKEEMQLTISLIPLAIESNRLLPSARGEKQTAGLNTASSGESINGTVEGAPLLSSTWIQAGELAALFGIFPEVLAALRPLAQRRHAHLGLAVVTRAAQARVVSFRGEVVALVHDVVFDVHAGLPCEHETKEMVEAVPSRHVGQQTCRKRAHTPLAQEGELFVAVLSVPAVQASVVHALQLKALQLSAEDVVLR